MDGGLGAVTHRVRPANATRRLGGVTLGDHLSCSNPNWVHSNRPRGVVSTVVEDLTPQIRIQWRVLTFQDP